jgi:hypothetical protein
MASLAIGTVQRLTALLAMLWLPTFNTDSLPGTLPTAVPKFLALIAPEGVGHVDSDRYGLKEYLDRRWQNCGREFCYESIRFYEVIPTSKHDSPDGCNILVLHFLLDFLIFHVPKIPGPKNAGSGVQKFVFGNFYWQILNALFF